jgi:division protein CdvB (Snf7/Vps24/ESCRT-III family)
MPKSRRKTKSTELIQFISKNPGLSIEEISKKLGWTRRSVKLILAKLEKTNKIRSRYFPTIIEFKDESWNIQKDISLEESKLEEMLINLKRKEKETFEKCIKAQMSKDDNLASMYANQCAEIKKLINTVITNTDLLGRMNITLERLRINLRK